MNPLTPVRRMTIRTAAAVFATAALAAGAQVTAASANAATSAASGNASGPAAADPYSPAYQHPYREGVVPTVQRIGQMRHWAVHQPQARASARNLRYGGGIDGIGVTTGHEKVYLVVYGSQWGTQSTNSNGDVTLSGDPSGQAPYQQELY